MCTKSHISSSLTELGGENLPTEPKKEKKKRQSFISSISYITGMACEGKRAAQIVDHSARDKQCERQAGLLRKLFALACRDEMKKRNKKPEASNIARTALRIVGPLMQLWRA